jgi:hypothetical protein
MPWVHFTADHYFTPAKNRRVTTHYKAGRVRNVVQECALQALAADKALRVKAPRTKAHAAALAAGEVAPEYVGDKGPELAALPRGAKV